MAGQTIAEEVIAQCETWGVGRKDKGLTEPVMSLFDTAAPNAGDN